MKHIPRAAVGQGLGQMPFSILGIFLPTQQAGLLRKQGSAFRVEELQKSITLLFLGVCSQQKQMGIERIVNRYGAQKLGISSSWGMTCCGTPNTADGEKLGRGER